MKTTEISKLSMNCNSLNTYLMDESLLLYSKNTQNVYGFEKGSVALFLKIGKLIGSHSYEEIAKQLPGVAAMLLKEMSDLASCKEAVDGIEYKASYQVQDNMDEKKFELILTNLISLPKYALVYSDLDEAVATVNSLTNYDKLNQ